MPPAVLSRWAALPAATQLRAASNSSKSARVFQQHARLGSSFTSLGRARDQRQVRRLNSLSVRQPLNSATQGQASAGKLKFKAGVKMMPAPDSYGTGGEDAWFISDNGLAMGIADGVGGWAEYGIDAGEFSRLLMKNCDEEAEKETVMMPGSPLRILQDAYTKTTVTGSCTACVIAMVQDTMHIANLGDSGILVIRRGKVVFKSAPQLHGFNFPYQLGSKEIESDPPFEADTYAVQLQEGDIIVLATDGLFDNIYEEEIARVGYWTCKYAEHPLEAAEHLTALAYTRALDKDIIVPFGVEARKAGYEEDAQGGKEDDITVIVSYVTSAE